MRKAFVVAVLFVTSHSNNAQSFTRSVIAEFAGLNAYSSEQKDSHSFLVNQAALANITQPGLSICGVREYHLKELSRYSAVAAWPTASGNFAVQLAYSGFVAYNESQIGFAYARALGETLDVGVQFNYAPVKITGYGTSTTVYAEFGLLMKLAEKLYAGIQASNPMGGFFGKNKKEKILSAYRAAFGFEASTKFITGFELEKQENSPVSIQASIQYQPVTFLQLRAGIRSGNRTGWFAAGFVIRNFRMDILAGLHPELGISSGLLFVYKFGIEKSTGHE